MNEILKIDKLDKSFGGVHAVNNISFSINEGEILGLIGPNGSGKTTCVNLISGIIKADNGHIIYNNNDITALSCSQRAERGIGRTFQSPKPFGNLSVYDNVLTASLVFIKNIKEARKNTEYILQITDLCSVSDMKSKELPIEKRKKLDLARVLAINPKLIMLDETMAGLNPTEMEESIKLIRQVNGMGITIVFIEHVMRAVNELCHRVIVLNEGQILCDGSPSFVMKNPEVIKAYLGGGYEIA